MNANNSNPKKYLGIDYGTKRVGVAISDDAGTLAFPLGVIQNLKPEDTAREIWNICGVKGGIEDVVLGESKNFKGEDNAVMEDVRQFAEHLKANHLNVIFEPEIFSTMQAERLQGQRSDIDASAAAVILQSYLERIRQEKDPQRTLEEIEDSKYKEIIK